MEKIHASVKSLLERQDSASWREGLSKAEAGSRAYPGAEPLYRLAGIAAFRLGEHERARRAFEKAIALEPKLAFNYLKLASLQLCELRDPASAAKLLARLWDALPEDLACREEAAEMYAKCGAAEDAVALYLHLVRLSPPRAWMYQFKAGQLYHAAGKYADARILLQRAVEAGPADRAELPAQLGATLNRAGDAKGARKCYEEALKRAPDPVLRRRLGEELKLLPGK